MYNYKFFKYLYTAELCCFAKLSQFSITDRNKCAIAVFCTYVAVGLICFLQFNQLADYSPSLMAILYCLGPPFGSLPM